MHWRRMADALTIARTARELGYRACTLGNATEKHWGALRVILGAENVPALVLADAVDLLLKWESPEEA
jgi:hypothetical protein